jgi:hypothetical protein
LWYIPGNPETGDFVKKAALLAMFSMVGAIGCAVNTQDESLAEGDHLESPYVAAWVPGLPMPTETGQRAGTLQMDWVESAHTLDALTDYSTLIVSGRVESVRYDVIRTYAQAKDSNEVPRDIHGNILHDDTPVTIATVRINEAARILPNLRTRTGGLISEGGTVDVLFPGGLLMDGTIVESDEDPLPKVGEETVLFLDQASGTAPLATGTLTGLFVPVDGPTGRLRVEDGILRGPAAGSEPIRSLATKDFHGKPTGALLMAAATRAEARAYLGFENRPLTTRPALHSDSVTQLWNSHVGTCAIPRNYDGKRCGNPTRIYINDYTGSAWPVSLAYDDWNYTGLDNSLYFTYGAGAYFSNPGVEIWQGWYPDSWLAMVDGRVMSGSCITYHRMRVNDRTSNSLSSAQHHAVLVHEFGHTLSFGHKSGVQCETIMDPYPANCKMTWCDATAAAELYPY